MDPNAEVKRTKGTRYVNADWSEISRTKKPGLQEVAVETVVYADGRVKEFILDGSGNRFPDPARQDFDDDQRKAWEAQKKDQPPEARASEGDTRGPQTGRTREVYRGGKWVVEDNPVYQGADSDWHTEGTPDSQGGYDNSRPIMVRTVGGKRETRQPTAKELEDWHLAGQMTRNPGGKTDAEIAKEKADADAAAARNAPKPVSTNTTEPYIVQAGPNGQLITSPNPNYVGEKPQRSTVKGADGRTYVVTLDKDGNATARPVEGLPTEQVGTPAEPAGAPPPDARYGAVSEGLTRYRDFLNQQVRLYKESGGKEGITAEQADKLMAARLASARATMDEQAGVVSTQTGIYGQDVTQRGQTLRETESRRGAAKDVYTSTLTQFTPLLKYMPQGGGQAFLDLLSHSVDAAQQKATAWGGMKDSPEIRLGPAAAAANAAPMPGQSVQSAPATQGSFLAPYGGAIAPVTAGITATNAAAIDPTGANVQAATDATMQGSQAAFGALGIDPAAAAATEAANQAAAAGAAQPAPGTPQSFLAPYQQQQPSTLDQLLNDSWLPNDVLARAYEDVYGTPLSSL